MADDHDLALVRSGSRELGKVDLRQADLSGGNFFNADLSGSQLDRSHFVNANLAAADLRGARIVGADFSGADLRGAKLPSTAVAVKFTGATLRGTRVQLRGENIDFRGADLVGADFTGSIFGADVLFDDAQADETSNFNGVEMLRATSRYPAFSNYDYEKGKLVRRNNSSPESQLTAGTAPTTLKDTVHTTVGGHIAVRLEEHPRDLGLMAAMLSATVRQELENIQSARPNEPSTLAYFERYSSFLEDLASSLDTLSVAISEAIRTPGKHRFSAAAQIVETIRERVDRWCTENTEIVAGVKQTTTIGRGIAFLSFCGAPPAFASAISAATFGGKKLARMIKDYYGKQEA
ncbi:MAG: pentapeptide repeat-containing protein [Mesorhizobium sp.]